MNKITNNMFSGCKNINLYPDSGFCVWKSRNAVRMMGVPDGKKDVRCRVLER